MPAKSETATSPFPPRIQALPAHRLSHWLLLTCLVALWGSAFAFAKIAVETIAPEWTMAGRMAVAALLLLPLCLIAGQRMPRGRQAWTWLAALALVGNIVPFFAIAWGQQHISSALAGILIGFTPLATLFIARALVPDERVTPLRLAGFAIGFAGLIVVIGPGAMRDFGGEGPRLLAQLAVLGGAFCFALNNVMARLAPAMPLIAKSTGVMLVGAPAGIVLASTATPPSFLVEAGPNALLALGALGLFPTALAALVFFRLVESAGPTFVSLSNYLVPVFAALAGYLIFGETLRPGVLAGFVMILAGIAISEWRHNS